MFATMDDMSQSPTKESAAMTTTFSTTLSDVETGYAVVKRDDTGRRIGHVRRDDMTGFWKAIRGNVNVATRPCHTRGDAVAELVAHVHATDAKLAKFLNS